MTNTLLPETYAIDAEILACNMAEEELRALIVVVKRAAPTSLDPAALAVKEHVVTSIEKLLEKVRVSRQEHHAELAAIVGSRPSSRL